MADTAAPGRTLGMGEVVPVTGRAAVTAPFGAALVAAAQRDSRIVGLSADLATTTPESVRPSASTTCRIR